MFVGGLADKNAAAAGSAFESTGEVYLPAKNGVIALADDGFGLGTHDANRGQSGIDPRAQEQDRQRLARRQPGGLAVSVLAFKLFVLGLPLAVELVNRA